MAIKLIIFDIGGVIIDFTEDQYIMYLSKKYGIGYKKLNAVMAPLIRKLEMGRLTMSQFVRIMHKKTGLSEEKLEWRSSYARMAKLNKRVFNLIEDLSKSYDVALLSNISSSRYHEALEKFLDNLHVVDIYVSFSTGFWKPDPRAYRNVLKKQRVKPNEALYIDNLIENVKGARKTGIDSILFRNYAQLEKELRKRGIA
jgi:putative hydrolase of the HAD superfamily